MCDIDYYFTNIDCLNQSYNKMQGNSSYIMYFLCDRISYKCLFVTAYMCDIDYYFTNIDCLNQSYNKLQGNSSYIMYFYVTVFHTNAYLSLLICVILITTTLISIA